MKTLFKNQQTNPKQNIFVYFIYLKLIQNKFLLWRIYDKDIRCKVYSERLI